MPATQSATRRNAAPTLDSYREAYIDVAPGVVLNGRITLPATTPARGVVAFPTVSRGPLHNPYTDSRCPRLLPQASRLWGSTA